MGFGNRMSSLGSEDLLKGFTSKCSRDRALGLGFRVIVCGLCVNGFRFWGLGLGIYALRFRGVWANTALGSISLGKQEFHTAALK